MNIPPYVAKLSPEVQDMWTHIAETSQFGTLAANQWLQSNVQSFVSTTKESRKVIRFNIQSGEEFIKRTDSGEEYITAVLEDIYGDEDGRRWTPEVLMKIADQINQDGIIGDVDHEAYDQILSSDISNDEATRLIQQKRGIAKGVKAIYEDGKLWIRALIDKRYKKLIQNAKGVSLEAVVTTNEQGITTDGKILGFTFAVDGTPANPRAVIVS